MVKSIFIFLAASFATAGMQAQHIVQNDSVHNVAKTGNADTSGSAFKQKLLRLYHFRRDIPDGQYKNFAGVDVIDWRFGLLNLTYERYFPEPKAAIRLAGNKHLFFETDPINSFFDTLTNVYYSNLKDAGITLSAYRYFRLLPGLKIRVGPELGYGSMYNYKFKEYSRYSPGGSLMTWYGLVPNGKMPYGSIGVELGARVHITKRIVVDFYGVRGKQLRREYSYYFQNNKLRTRYTDKFRPYRHAGIILGFLF